MVVPIDAVTGGIGAVEELRKTYAVLDESSVRLIQGKEQGMFTTP